MTTSRITFLVSVCALATTLALGTRPAQAQTWYAVYNPVFYNPWNVVTHHDLSFVSVSEPQEYQQPVLFGGSYTYGIYFDATTASGQTYRMQILGPGGNLLATRIGSDEFQMMWSVVQAFHDNPQFYGTLSFTNVEKRFYTAYTVTPSSKLTIDVPSPAVPTDTDVNGGLIELVVNASGDFYAEAKIRRSGSCSSSYRRSRVSVLRNAKAFILNNTTSFTTLNPASAAMARLFVDTAVDGVPFLDVSGSEKLEDNDPYHLTGGWCVRSTYIIDNYQYIQING